METPSAAARQARQHKPSEHFITPTLNSTKIYATIATLLTLYVLGAGGSMTLSLYNDDAQGSLFLCCCRCCRVLGTELVGGEGGEERAIERSRLRLSSFFAFHPPLRGLSRPGKGERARERRENKVVASRGEIGKNFSRNKQNPTRPPLIYDLQSPGELILGPSWTRINQEGARGAIIE